MTKNAKVNEMAGVTTLGFLIGTGALNQQDPILGKKSEYKLHLLDKRMKAYLLEHPELREQLNKATLDGILFNDQVAASKELKG